MEDSQEKTMLITGAAGGIGRATVELFTEQGWRVIGVDRAEIWRRISQQEVFLSNPISPSAKI